MPTLTAHIVYRLHLMPLVHSTSMFLEPYVWAPKKAFSERHAPADPTKEQIAAFDRSTLDPDFVWMQLDAGPEITAYLHGSLLRYINNFKVSPHLS